MYNESTQVIQRESNEESHVAANVHQKVQVVKNYQYQILECEVYKKDFEVMVEIFIFASE